MTRKQPATKPLEIREGRYYARADGSVHGPAKENGLAREASSFRWALSESEGVTLTYCSDGRYTTLTTSAYDLIKEVPAPTAKPPTPAKRSARWVVVIECRSRQDARRQMKRVHQSVSTAAVVKDNGK